MIKFLIACLLLLSGCSEIDAESIIYSGSDKYRTVIVYKNYLGECIFRSKIHDTFDDPVDCAGAYEMLHRQQNGEPDLFFQVSDYWRGGSD